MAKKRMKLKIFAILLIVTLIGLSGYAMYSGKMPSLSAIGQDAIFCNEWGYRCCYEDTMNPTYETVILNMKDDSEYNIRVFVCPWEASRCVISSIEESSLLGSGASTRIYSNCDEGDSYTNFWGTEFTDWECTGDQGIATIGRELSPSQYIGIDNQWKGYSRVVVQIFSKELIECGLGGTCTTGNKVSGTTDCSFVPNTWQGIDVYDANNNLVDSDYTGQIHVEAGECIRYTSKSLRRLCGFKSEECEDTSDCIQGREITYKWQGVTYGAEWNAGEIVLYDCETYGVEPSEDTLFNWGLDEGDQGTSEDFNYGSYCTATRTIPNIECHPEAPGSCPSGSACDPSTFTCEELSEVECTRDKDCGIHVYCDEVDDYFKILEPKCISGTCKDVERDKVDCCVDDDCGLDEFCDSDYECKESPTSLATCPYDCCVNIPNVRDKTCKNDQVCCEDHSCAANLEACGIGNEPVVTDCLAECDLDYPHSYQITKRMTCYTDECGEELFSIYDLLGILFGGLAGMFAFIFGRNIGKKQKFKGYMPSVFGLILGVLVFGVTFLLWWVALIALIISIFLVIVFRPRYGAYQRKWSKK